MLRSPKYHPFLLGLLAILTAASQPSAAQNLHFGIPHPVLAGITTDRSTDVTHFKGGFFLTWKEPGQSGRVRMAYLGRQYDTTGSHHQETLPGDERSAFAPVFRVWKDRLYLFWIAPNGSVRYTMNSSDTGFVTAPVYTLEQKNPLATGETPPRSIQPRPPVSLGINAAVLGDDLVLASHAADNHHIVYAVTQPAPDGILAPADWKTLPTVDTQDYPFVVSIDDSTAQFTWRGVGSNYISRGNFNPRTEKWLRISPIAHTTAGAAPAVYHLWNSQSLFFVWSEPGKEGRLHYSVHTIGDTTYRETGLPDYFNTTHPVSLCNVDGNNFLVSFVDRSGTIYLSRFANYNPSTWMADILLREKSDYTLQDIVIPGSHDAGMSVLNGVGGSQSGTINECNTLTQAKDIGQQLHAGLRMFDLRVGSYKGQLYIKHCSSDCMSEAIGGGYGEKLVPLLQKIRNFLGENRGEFVLLTFSHFCERETPVKELAATILTTLGPEHVYRAGKAVSPRPRLRDLAGKVIISFEGFATPDGSIDSCTIATRSNAFINFRREYAATNKIAKLLASEEQFFRGLPGTIQPNDLVRLDWQLSQSSDEAAMICNEFQHEKTNPLLDAAMLLTNTVRRHKSILNLSLDGNVYLPSRCNEWIAKKIITPANKPNILYVDAAGDWITDYCVYLNQTELYRVP
jgi:hypothetical protein